MKEKQQEQPKKLSKFQQKFLAMIMHEPHKVFDSLAYLDTIKPLVWKDLVRNGGKLGIEPIAKKYGVSPQTVRSLIKQVKENQKGIKALHFRKQKQA